MVAKPPECLVGRASVACPWRGLWSQNPPSACSKCSRPRWNGGDMGFLGCSGRRFGRAGAWRGIFCGAAREGGASWCVLVTYFCAAAGEVLPRMVRFFCGGIGWVSCARVLVCSCARVLVCSCARVLVGTIDRTVGVGVPMQPFPTAESIHVGAIHVGRCLLAAAFMRRGVVVVSFVRRPEQAMNISRIE